MCVCVCVRAWTRSIGFQSTGVKTIQTDLHKICTSYLLGSLYIYYILNLQQRKAKLY